MQAGNGGGLAAKGGRLQRAAVAAAKGGAPLAVGADCRSAHTYLLICASCGRVPTQ